MNKKLFNKLSRVAFILTESEFVDCDAEIDENRIRLCNWRHGMVSTPALCLIVDICKQYDLHFYVDFVLKDVTIHG